MTKVVVFDRVQVQDRKGEAMTFIETLKSVGGVKPCLKCSGTGDRFRLGDGQDRCNDCEGTGKILDLAPLLARPKELGECVEKLVIAQLPHTQPNHGLAIVGPQRAHSLVYEVARQLGGTAVVMIEDIEIAETTTKIMVDDVEDVVTRKVVERQGYRLSLPIPPDATVLFVTDRMDEQEMMAIMNCATSSGKFTVLPYILSLVWDGKEMPLHAMTGKETFKVISLHQEKP